MGGGGGHPAPPPCCGAADSCAACACGAGAPGVGGSGAVAGSWPGRGSWLGCGSWPGRGSVLCDGGTDPWTSVLSASPGAALDGAGAASDGAAGGFPCRDSGSFGGLGRCSRCRRRGRRDGRDRGALVLGAHSLLSSVSTRSWATWSGVWGLGDDWSGGRTVWRRAVWRPGVGRSGGLASGGLAVGRAGGLAVGRARVDGPADVAALGPGGVLRGAAVRGGDARGRCRAPAWGSATTMVRQGSDIGPRTVRMPPLSFSHRTSGHCKQELCIRARTCAPAGGTMTR